MKRYEKKYNSCHYYFSTFSLYKPIDTVFQIVSFYKMVFIMYRYLDNIFLTLDKNIVFTYTDENGKTQTLKPIDTDTEDDTDTELEVVS